MLWLATCAAALAIAQFWMLLCLSQRETSHPKPLLKLTGRVSATKQHARAPRGHSMGPVHVQRRAAAVVELFLHSSVVRSIPDRTPLVPPDAAPSTVLIMPIPPSVASLSSLQFGCLFCHRLGRVEESTEHMLDKCPHFVFLPWKCCRYTVYMAQM